MTHIELEISNPCNEKCLHCYRVCRSTKKGFLSARQAQSVLEQAKALGARHATMTGGEILLNPQWREIARTADGMGFRVSLFTNGSLMTEDDADFIGTLSHLKEVQLSLYALEPQVHDAITGLAGSCERTIAAVNMLRGRGIPIFVSCPSMQENKAVIADVMRWCDDSGIPSCTDIYIFGSSDYSRSNLPHRLTYDDLRKFYETTMRDGARLSYVWGKGHGGRDLSQIQFYGGACSSLCVSGDGTICPMIGWYEPLGNIGRDSLADVFHNNPLLKKIRAIHASDFAECVSCGHSDFCDFCCMTHLAANGGQLGKLDRDYCESVRLRKELARMRDETLGQAKSREG